jgi:hypothetical protein
MIDNVNANNLPDDLVIRFMNMWFFKESPVNKIGKFDREHSARFINGFLLGDDAVYAHEKSFELINLLKEYCILDYDKNPMELYYKGKMRSLMKIRNAFNSPKVMSEFNALLKVMGDVSKDLEKELNKEKEEKDKMMITSRIANSRINLN